MLSFAAQVKISFFSRAHINTLCLILLPKSNSVSHVSLLSALDQFNRGPYFIMGTNHAARETACVLILVWFLQRYQRFFANACNIVRTSVRTKKCPIMQKKKPRCKSDMFVFLNVYWILKNTMLLF